MANTHSTQADWFQTQKNYWDTWLESQRRAFDETTPFSSLMQEWQRLLSSQNIPNTDVFMQHFTKAGAPFLDMMQQYYQATGQAKPLDDMTREWTSKLNDFYKNIFQGSTQPFDTAEAYRRFQSLWSFPQAGAAHAPDPFAALDPMGFFAAMPGIGYTREKQEQVGALYKQWVEFERRARDYNAAMAKVGMDALQKFQDYLANPPKDTPPLQSLKAIYGKWVDVCEDVYAKYAMSQEYTDLYGDVVNALMAFKKQQNQIVDQMMAQMNLPTRAEVDSLHKRVHELRRELSAFKKAKKGKKS